MAAVRDTGSHYHSRYLRVRGVVGILVTLFLSLRRHGVRMWRVWVVGRRRRRGGIHWLGSHRRLGPNHFDDSEPTLCIRGIPLFLDSHFNGYLIPIICHSTRVRARCSTCGLRNMTRSGRVTHVHVIQGRMREKGAKWTRRGFIPSLPIADTDRAVAKWLDDSSLHSILLLLSKRCAVSVERL